MLTKDYNLFFEGTAVSRNFQLLSFDGLVLVISCSYSNGIKQMLNHCGDFLAMKGNHSNSILSYRNMISMLRCSNVKLLLSIF